MRANGLVLNLSVLILIGGHETLPSRNVRWVGPFSRLRDVNMRPGMIPTQKLRISTCQCD